MNIKRELFGTKELTKHLQGFLLAESSLVKGLLSQELDSRTNQIKVVLGSCCQSATAIAKLCENSEYFYAEAIVLARGFIEKIVNFCYLLVCDEDEFNRFLKHTVQKSYRKLDRSIRVSGVELNVKFNGKIDINSNPLLKEALEEFTSEKGKEKTHWTTVNLENRIRLLAQRTKLNIGIFLLNTLSIYEDASESLHGTLYGCSFHTWAYEPNIDYTNSAEVERNTQKKISLLFLQLGSLFHEAIILLSEKNEIQEVLKGSKENNKNALKLMKSLFEKHN